MDPNDRFADIFRLLQLAVSVLNSKVINAIVNLISVNAAMDITNEMAIIFSEVLYDLSIYRDWATMQLEVSLYLSNNGDIIGESQIDVLYKRLSYIDINEEFDTKIYDAETALRLSTLINVKPFLDPATEFDKNLMIQFGLL